MQIKQERAFEISLDKNKYASQDLIELRIPLNMPYQLNTTEFERVDGKLILHGKIYSMVKRKITDNVLIVMCLPDEQSEKFENAKDDFFKLTNDVATNSNNKRPVSNTIKIMFSVYDTHKDQWKFRAFLNKVTFSSIQNEKILSSCFVVKHPKPPQVINHFFLA